MDILTFMMHFIETLVSGLDGIRTGIIRFHEKTNGQFEEIEKKFSKIAENMDKLSVSVATHNSTISEAHRKAEYAVSMAQ